MTNGILFFFQSGYAYPVGIAMLLGSVAASLFYSKLSAKAATLFLMGTGLLLMLFSGVFPGPLFRFLIILCIMLFVALQYTADKLKTFTYSIRAVIVILCLYAFADEYKTMTLPIARGSFQSVYAVDSMSETAFDNSSWLKRISDKPEDGSTRFSASDVNAANALRLLDKINPKNALLILRLDFRDAAGKYSPAEFGEYLDKFFFELNKKAENTCTILMFELPVMPLDTQYLHVQRQTAKKHRVKLIPRHLSNRLNDNPESLSPQMLEMLPDLKKERNGQ